MKINDISQGSDGDTVTVFYYGGNIHEIEQEVADGILYSTDFCATPEIRDLRSSKNMQMTLRFFFPYLSEEAYCAILSANLRGVGVRIICKNIENHRTKAQKILKYDDLKYAFNHKSRFVRWVILKLLGLYSC